MCSLKKGVLRNFVKFTGKHLHQSLFFNRVAGLRPATLLKKRPWRRCFPVNFTKFLRIPFSQNTSGRLLLIVVFKILSNVHDGDFLRKYSHHTCLKGSYIRLWIVVGFNISQRAPLYLYLKHVRRWLFRF